MWKFNLYLEAYYICFINVSINLFTAKWTLDKSLFNDSKSHGLCLRCLHDLDAMTYAMFNI